MDHVAAAGHDANMPRRIVTDKKNSIAWLRIANRLPPCESAVKFSHVAPPRRQLEAEAPHDLDQEAHAVISLWTSRAGGKRLSKQIEPQRWWKSLHD